MSLLRQKTADMIEELTLQSFVLCYGLMMLTDFHCTV